MLKYGSPHCSFQTFDGRVACRRPSRALSLGFILDSRREKDLAGVYRYVSTEESTVNIHTAFVVVRVTRA